MLLVCCVVLVVTVTRNYVDIEAVTGTFVIAETPLTVRMEPRTTSSMGASPSWSSMSSPWLAAVSGSSP